MDRQADLDWIDLPGNGGRSAEASGVAASGNNGPCIPEGILAARPFGAEGTVPRAVWSVTGGGRGPAPVGPAAPPEQVPANWLDLFCPMHLLLDRAGRITHAGPTFGKLCPGRDLTGRSVFELLEWRRRGETVSHEGPAGPTAAMGGGNGAESASQADMAALLEAAGRTLRFRLRAAPGTGFKGVVAPDGQGGGMLNLSFGISVVEAVRDHALTSRDLAPTDLTIEMLYLVEAKTAAMEASRDLNLRLQGAKIAAEEQAFTDTLTGLKNRRAMDHVLDRLGATPRHAPFALMHLDLDLFKQVNDSLGHAAGDHVLQEVARILVDETRSDDVVARVGGDEFVIVFHDLAGRERLEQVAQRIISRLERPIPFAGRTCRISASAGSVLSDRYAVPDGVQMLVDADRALYASKRRGRGQHTFFFELEE